MQTVLFWALAGVLLFWHLVADQTWSTFFAAAVFAILAMLAAILAALKGHGK